MKELQEENKDLKEPMELPQDKKGEKLRLKVEVWGKKTGGATTTMGQGHDRKDRTAESVAGEGVVVVDEDTTILEFHVPFQLDL